MNSERKSPEQPVASRSASAANGKRESSGGRPSAELTKPESQSPAASEEPLSDVGLAARTGKDELNLVEYPWAALGKRSDCVISHEWEARHPVSGKALKASWRVETSPELGLPTASDMRVYLVLMEITRDQKFSQTVTFTRHALVKRLGWPHNQKSYDMLFNAFRRLRSLTISARNSFWDAEIKSFRDAVFGIIEAAEIVSEKAGRKSKDAPEPSSYFKWSDMMHASFQSGYMRTFDLDFALSLKGDIALSLYRYLGKKAFGGRRSFEIELATLHQRHLGLKATPYASKIKERLDPAHAELQERGFIESVCYEPMKTKRAEKVCYSFPSPKLAQSELPAPGRPHAGDAVQTLTPTLLHRMLDLKISAEVASELLNATAAEQLALQLDCLPDRNPKNPAAVFIKAVRGAWDAPTKYLERLEAQERAKNARAAQTTSQAQKAQQKALAAQQRALVDDESARLDAEWEKLDPKTRTRIENTALDRLGVLGRSGRAQGALVAMRRNLLRDEMAKEQVEN